MHYMRDSFLVYFILLRRSFMFFSSKRHFKLDCFLIHSSMIENNYTRKHDVWSHKGLLFTQRTYISTGENWRKYFNETFLYRRCWFFLPFSSSSSCERAASIQHRLARSTGDEYERVSGRIRDNRKFVCSQPQWRTCCGQSAGSRQLLHRSRLCRMISSFFWPYSSLFHPYSGCSTSFARFIIHRLVSRDFTFQVNARKRHIDLSRSCDLRVSICDRDIYAIPNDLLINMAENLCGK